MLLVFHLLLNDSCSCFPVLVLIVLILVVLVLVLLVPLPFRPCQTTFSFLSFQLFMLKILCHFFPWDSSYQGISTVKSLNKYHHPTTQQPLHEEPSQVETPAGLRRTSTTTRARIVERFPGTTDGLAQLLNGGGGGGVFFWFLVTF